MEGGTKKMAEKDIQKQIMLYLDYLGAWTVKTIATNKAGTPDILFCLNGKFGAIEVKDTRQYASPLQDAQIRRIIRAGGVAFEADSLEKAKRILSEKF